MFSQERGHRDQEKAPGQAGPRDAAHPQRPCGAFDLSLAGGGVLVCCCWPWTSEPGTSWRQSLS